MRNKPWKMKEGFAIGIGLIAVGVVLQLAVGPVAWGAFAWPINGVVMAAFVAVIALTYILRKRVYAFKFLGTNHAAIPAMALAVVLTIVMGLTIQSPGQLVQQHAELLAICVGIHAYSADIGAGDNKPHHAF